MFWCNFNNKIFSQNYKKSCANKFSLNVYLLSLQLMLLFSQHCRPQWFESCHFLTFKGTLRSRLWNGQRMSAKKHANFQWARWSKILFFHGYVGEYVTYGVMTELAPVNSTKLLFPKQNWSWIKYLITIVIYSVSTSETLTGSAIIRILMLTFVSSISKQC